MIRTKVSLMLMATLTLTNSYAVDISKPVMSMPKEFITMCTNADVETSSTLVIAYVNCMGRVRGYVDGHQMTIDLQYTVHEQYSKLLVLDPLWCIPTTVTDRELLFSVVDWTNSNHKDFKALAKRYPGGAGVSAVITKALSTKYPCK